MSPVRSLAFPLALVLVLALPARPQSLNVKCGAGALSPTYGAASGSAGVWNPLSMPTGGNVPLVDLAGAPTGAYATAEACDQAHCSWCETSPCSNVSGGSADDVALLSGWFNGDCFASGHNVQVHGLAPGTYRLSVYATGGCAPLTTNGVEVKTFAGAALRSQLAYTLGGVVFDGTWPAYPVGRHFVEIDAGDLLDLRWSSVTLGGLAGFQLEHLATIGQPFCSGDGSSGPCPCPFPGTPGRGCRNSSGLGGARLSATGSTGDDSVVLLASAELSTSLSIFSQGDQPIAPVPFGDGLRCVGGALKRLYVETAQYGSTSAPQLGEPSILARSAALGDPIPAGATRHYYVYYRDPGSFCPGATFNATNALSLTW